MKAQHKSSSVRLTALGAGLPASSWWRWFWAFLGLFGTVRPARDSGDRTEKAQGEELSLPRRLGPPASDAARAAPRRGPRRGPPVQVSAPPTEPDGGGRAQGPGSDPRGPGPGVRDRRAAAGGGPVRERAPGRGRPGPRLEGGRAWRGAGGRLQGA
ncbi:hypothetical protein GH733_017356 [Mirounga leonina]|nr:hypothetical protein GH733_017356 [Mirounga leonina]